MECIEYQSLPPLYIGDCFATKHLAQYCAYSHHKIVIITDSNVNAYYEKSVTQYFLSQNCSIHHIVISAGEHSKNRKTKAYIEDRLFALGCGRDTLLIALGGGVVTDLVGFVAATYCRGISVIYIPTSLLAMVDAALGGKTGINTAYGKNTLGTFTQPIVIFININFLNSLPHKEYVSAFAEIIKHGLIENSAYCHLLMNSVAAVKEKDHLTLEKIIRGSCKIKSTIVVDDEREQGKRELLNFGHTVGHALELASDYTLSHGEAVALGIMEESKLAHRMGLLTEKDLFFIKKLLTGYELPITLPESLSREAIKAHLNQDKKIRNSELRCVLLTEIGKALCIKGSYAHSVNRDLLLLS
ncbi:MAG: 3-dehydroquinate synthase [Gammaproteobacteria bacterium]